MTFVWWDGTTSTPVTPKYWDGSTAQDMTVAYVSDGSAPVPPTPSEKPTAGLAFDLDPALNSTSSKLVFAHYFPPYPRSKDNKDPSQDYYTTGYLNIHGENNTHLAYGGFHRNRPMGRAPLSGSWQALDVQSEIDNARAAGLDGFFVDMLSASSTSPNTVQENLLIATANSYVPDGSFKVVPMVDTTASFTTQLSVDQMSDRIAGYSTGPSAWFLPDGRYVVSSFKGETYNAAWWDALFQNLKTRHGLNVAFLMGLLSIGSWSNYQGYPWSYGFGDWGDGADPAIAATTGASEHATAPHNAGYKWMQPIQGENVRPSQGWFDEALGTAALRGWWDRALRNGSDYCQIVTWSDWSESGAVASSVTSGNVNLDISSWYIYQLKTGTTPNIVRDVMYLTHRSHFHNVDWTTTAAYAAGERTFMVQKADRIKKSPVSDVVEVLTFFTAPADVVVNVGGNTYTYTAQAGMYAQTFPLAAGTVSASAARNGLATVSVTSRVQVQPVSNTFKDEFVYYRFSSERGTTGQYNPNLA